MPAVSFQIFVLSVNRNSGRLRLRFKSISISLFFAYPKSINSTDHDRLPPSHVRTTLLLQQQHYSNMGTAPRIITVTSNGLYWEKQQRQQSSCGSRSIVDAVTAPYNPWNENDCKRKRKVQIRLSIYILFKVKRYKQLTTRHGTLE
jgi:hypothetical protein